MLDRSPLWGLGAKRSPAGAKAKCYINVIF